MNVVQQPNVLVVCDERKLDGQDRARGSRTQYLHGKSDRYRTAVRRKLAAYHRHIQVGLISQGILHYLAVKHPRWVWASFGSWWLGIPPSELITAAARELAPDGCTVEPPPLQVLPPG